MKAYQIKFELTGSEPLIWRRVTMPAGATFKRLHDTIQNTLNFQSGYPSDPIHLYEFDLEDEEGLLVTNNMEAYHENKHYKSHYKRAILDGKTDPFGAIARHLKITVRQPQTIKIDKYLETWGELVYNYDFGDDWQITIRLEDTVEDYHYGYPVLVDGAGTAPPEDVGGLPGYSDFLESYHNSGDPYHESVREWAEGQRYREYDKEWINRRLKALKYKKTEWDKL